MRRPISVMTMVLKAGAIRSDFFLKKKKRKDFRRRSVVRPKSLPPDHHSIEKYVSPSRVVLD